MKKIILLAICILSLYCTKVQGQDQFSTKQEEVIQVSKEAITAKNKILYQNGEAGLIDQYYINKDNINELDHQKADIQYRAQYIKAQDITSIQEDFEVIDVQISKDDAVVYIQETLNIFYSFNESYLYSTDKTEIRPAVSSSQTFYTQYLIKKGNTWYIYEEIDPQPWDSSSANDISQESTAQTAQTTFANELNALGSPILYYNRAGAASYADAHVDNPNPNYRIFSSDCTNFVSQSGHEGGGIGMKYSTPWPWYYSWYYSYSNSWTVAQDLNNTIINLSAGAYRSSASALDIGDVIFYDWQNDGHIDHSAIVVAFNALGGRLIDTRSNPHYHVLWDLKQYGAPATTRYYFVHIISAQ